MGRRPWHTGCLADEQDSKYENDSESDQIEFHVRPLLSGGLAVPKTAAEIHTTLKRGFANESIVQRAGERSQGASCEMVSGMGRIMAMAVTSIRAARQEDEDELAELRTLLWPDGTVEQHRFCSSPRPSR